MEGKFITIIIPAYKDWPRLSICLNALANQSYPKELFEIVVVNNNPDEEMPNGYSTPENCTLITESKPGSYAARNAGLKIARGEIIGFTDSDCIPDKDWIKNAVEHFTNNNVCTRIAGEVSIFFKTAEHPTKAELYDKLYALNQGRYVSIWGTGVTANLFVYKYVFDKLGFFNEKLMSGGDFYWGISARKAGYNIDYVKNVIVNHPARYSLNDLIKKEKRIGGGQAFHIKRKKSASKVTNILRSLKAIYNFQKELWPKLAEFKFIRNNGKDLSIIDKVYLLLLRRYLRSIRAYEKFMVQMGRRAKRE